QDLFRGQLFIQKIGFFLFCAGNLKSFFHQQHNNTLKSDGKSGCRCRCTCKFSDHLVVASAAAYASCKSINGNLKDRSCIIGHSSYQGGVKLQCEVCCLCLHNAFNNCSKII